MTAILDDLASVAQRWDRWASTSAALADLDDEQGDAFGAALKRARAQIRHEAAVLLRAVAEPAEAAKIMRANLAALWQREAPLIGYDPVALDYTRARTWQACARELDPTVPAIQPRWD